MTHSKEKIEEWIQEQYANDYYMFEHIQADFKVLSFQLDGNSLDVIYSFIADESKFGNESEDSVLFRFDETNWSGFFPNRLQLITIKSKYTWPTTLEYENLTDGYEEEDEWAHSDWISWDDNRISEATALGILNHYDEEAIVETLINKYSAANAMPSFIPNRLKIPIQQMIKDYLKGEQD